jgi:hypothetical protein
MELKTIDLTANTFDANGVTYLVKPSLSVERFRWFEKYQVNFGFARDFKGIYDMLSKSVNLADKGKGLEAWNIIFNLKEEVGKNLDNRSHTAMYICALFIVTADEDLTVWDESIAETKIANWNKEGYDVNNFFRLAANLVNGFIDILEDIFQDTSELVAQLEMAEETMTKSTLSVLSKNS